MNPWTPFDGQGVLMIRAAVVDTEGKPLNWQDKVYRDDLVIVIPADGTLYSLDELKASISKEVVKTIPLLSVPVLARADVTRGIQVKSIFTDGLLSETWTEMNWQTMATYAALNGARLRIAVDKRSLEKKIFNARGGALTDWSKSGPVFDKVYMM